jgi:hypothetical protein
MASNHFEGCDEAVKHFYMSFSDSQASIATTGCDGMSDDVDVVVELCILAVSANRPKRPLLPLVTERTAQPVAIYCAIQVNPFTTDFDISLKFEV